MRFLTYPSSETAGIDNNNDSMTYLMSNLYNGFDTIVTFKETFLEVVALSRNPNRLLRIVGPVLVISFHLQGEELKRLVVHFNHWCVSLVDQFTKKID